MTLPIELPSWMPSWLFLLTAVLILFVVLCYLAMPFSVFGVKARLDAIEARLDEIQGEIRTLAFRLPERGDDDRYGEEREPRFGRPPIPPASRAAPSPRSEPRFGPRREPRMDWPER